MLTALVAVGNPAAQSSAAVTSIVNNVPAGTQNGDFLIWAEAGNVATAPTTPTGWNLWQSAVTTTTGLNLAIYWRIASSEPTTYTMTTSSAIACATMLAYRGVSTVTPRDLAGAVGTAGTTSFTFTLRTPTMQFNWALGIAAAEWNTASPGVLSSSNMTVDSNVVSAGASSVNNVGLLVGHIQYSGSGSVTPAVSSSTTPTVTATHSSAMRQKGAVSQVGRRR